MTAEEKTLALQFNIGRFDHYYDSINNKGNLYLTLNTFILGGILTGYYALDSVHHFNSYYHLFLFIPTLFCNLLSFTYTLSAIRPFMKKHPSDKAKSMLFFVDVGNEAEVNCLQQWGALTKDQWQSDLVVQNHQLAKGLLSKFNCLHCATGCIGLQVGLIIIFSVIFLMQSNF